MLSKTPPLPESLLQSEEVPILPKIASNADISEYANQLLLQLQQCDLDKLAIRQIV